MTTFVVLYRGATIADAKMIAMSVDAALVGSVASAILEEEAPPDVTEDAILGAFSSGRRQALSLVAGGLQTEGGHGTA